MQVSALDLKYLQASQTFSTTPAISRLLTLLRLNCFRKSRIHSLPNVPLAQGWHVE